MIDYKPLVQRWQDTPLQVWGDQLELQIGADFHPARYGDLPKWLAALDALPTITADQVTLDQATVGVAGQSALDAETKVALEQTLRELHPWRKGPFDLFGVHIDTEWRSDWKWQRLESHIKPLTGRRVLDVGCGSGYHCWRMLGAGASEVIGIDPGPLFVVQFWALQKYIQNPDIWVLPLGIQHVPAALKGFDTVFSMGVLYHRRSPMDHLLELRDCLVAGGELVLETLVIDAGHDQCLVPGERYARMGNVWFLPSPQMLCNWLKKTGFRDVEVVDVTTTTVHEQRSTDWMRFHSLAEFLDPDDATRTIEGHPAPLRAIVRASAPG